MKAMTVVGTLAAAAALALAGCNRADENAAATGSSPSTAPAEAGRDAAGTPAAGERPADAVVTGTPRAADEAGRAADRVGDAAARTGEAVESAGERAAEATRNAAERAGDAAARGTERAADAVSDAAITASVNAELARDKELSALKIDVDTDNAQVTLKGSAPNQAAAERATRLAHKVDGVKSVDNQLRVESR